MIWISGIFIEVWRRELGKDILRKNEKESTRLELGEASTIVDTEWNQKRVILLRKKLKHSWIKKIQNYKYNVSKKVD